MVFFEQKTSLKGNVLMLLSLMPTIVLGVPQQASNHTTPRDNVTAARYKPVPSTNETLDIASLSPQATLYTIPFERTERYLSSVQMFMKTRVGAFDYYRDGRNPDNFTYSYLYTTIAKVGTPAQWFRARISFTTHTPLWLYSTDCLNAKCLSHKRFNASKSKTFRVLNGYNMASNDHMDGYSIVGEDAVQIGSSKSTNQTLDVIEDAWAYPSENPPPLYDGVLDPGSFTSSFFKKKYISTNAYGFYISKTNRSAELTVGGWNTKRFKPPARWISGGTSPVITRFALGKKVIPIEPVYGDGSKQYVSFTLNYPFIASNHGHIEAINNAIGTKKATDPAIQGLPIVNCSAKLGNFSMAFQDSGFLLTLNPREYLFPLEKLGLKYSNGVPKYKGLCMSKFVGTDVEGDAPDRWFIGDVFHRKYYTIMDLKNNKLGFAELI